MDSITIPVTRRLSPSRKAAISPSCEELALFAASFGPTATPHAREGPTCHAATNAPSTSEFPWGDWQARTFILGG
jgi:hypothetical protein